MNELFAFLVTATDNSGGTVAPGKVKVDVFAFVVTATDNTGGTVAPVDVKVKVDVLEQMLGTIMQAGSTKVLSIASDGAVCSKVWSLKPELAQSTVLAHLTKMFTVAVLAWVTNATEVSVNDKVHL